MELQPDRVLQGGLLAVELQHGQPQVLQLRPAHPAVAVQVIPAHIHTNPSVTADAVYLQSEDPVQSVLRSAVEQQRQAGEEVLEGDQALSAAVHQGEHVVRVGTDGACWPVIVSLTE